jgi:hypothetical protein
MAHSLTAPHLHCPIAKLIYCSIASYLILYTVKKKAYQIPNGQRCPWESDQRHLVIRSIVQNGFRPDFFYSVLPRCPLTANTIPPYPSELAATQYLQVVSLYGAICLQKIVNKISRFFVIESLNL